MASCTIASGSYFLGASYAHAASSSSINMSKGRSSSDHASLTLTVSGLLRRSLPQHAIRLCISNFESVRSQAACLRLTRALCQVCFGEACLSMQATMSFFSVSLWMAAFCADSATQLTKPRTWAARNVWQKRRYAGLKFAPDETT